MSDSDAYGAIEHAFVADPTREAIAGLSDEQRRRLRAYWVDRADGELTTALSFEFMLTDLREEGAPASLLELAETAIADEHRHVDWCVRWAIALGDGESVRASLGGTRRLTFEGASPHDDRLLRTVFGGCFSETVALHVLLASQALTTVDSVRRLTHAHVKEEVGHARLGWALLGWSGVLPRDRTMIAAHVPEMTRLTRMVWQSTEREADARLHELGFLSSPLVQKACDEAFAEVIVPGLAYHGVG